jgi:acyl-CoA synthetase (NDP forming)
MKPFADLSRLINPKNVVVVGASARSTSQGGRLYENLVVHSALKGKVYAVNPAYSEINGAPCWPTISALPEEVELDVALVIVSGKLVLGVLRECALRKVPFAIVMSSGFSEAGEAGSKMEFEIAQLCESTGLRVYGPNCPGFVNVRDRIGMTFSPAFKNNLHGGRIGLATQGGGLGRNLLQGLSKGPGVGLWFSAGNEVDLEVPDFIAHMAQDPQIDVIGVLMEGVQDGRRLTAALKLASDHSKPIVMLKIGHSAAGIKAAQSHTASVAGSAAVNSAVFKQFGVIEVNDLNELLAAAQLLSRGSVKNGKGLCVYTFSGGTAALAADIAGTAGLPMPRFSDETQRGLRYLLPDFAAIDNPVDTTADILRNQDAATQCLRLVCNDPNIGVVLLPIPMDYAEVTDKIAESIVEVARNASATLVPVWMSRRLGGGFQILEESGLAPFFSLTDAIRTLKAIWPADRIVQNSIATSLAIKASENRLKAKALSEVKSKKILSEIGIKMPYSELATSDEQAVEIQRNFGSPMVMKIASADIPHKTDAGGVRIGLKDEHEIRNAFSDILKNVKMYNPHARIDGVLIEAMLPKNGLEVIIGVHNDPAYGPILTFGLGGIFVEIFRDVTHRMLPITRSDAHAMIREIRHADILYGARGQSEYDLNALEDMLLKVSDFAYLKRDKIVELELNPVWVGNQGQGAFPLDALIIER